MANEVISYLEMCGREGMSLQRGTNFGLGGDHSVVLMSVRPNAPYRDRLEDNGTTLIYVGHDEPQSECWRSSTKGSQSTVSHRLRYSHAERQVP